MANGHRRGGGPGRSEETRIAPEDEDATRDIPTFTPEETRVAPPEAREEGDGQEDIITEAKGPARARPVGAGGGVPVKSEGASSWDEDEATSIMGLPGGARRPGAEGEAPPPFATEVRGTGASAKVGRGDADAPLPFATEVRGGGVPAKGGRGDADAPLPFATEVRGGGAPATEVRGGPPPVLRGPPGNAPSGGRMGSEKPANWLSRGGEKPSTSGNTAGVVRLSPLEPANGKTAAAEESGPALRTMYANHSALLAEQLRDALSKKVYGRGPHRVLRIDEPEGPSTAGGKLARQAISLVPRKGSGPSLMCGWVDVSKREAQLRAYDGVARRYEAHHGEPLELQPEEYERFLGDVEDALIKAVIKVRLLLPEEPADASAATSAAKAKARGGLSWPLVLLLMGAAFALGLFVGRTPG
ncbi:hypothetical protein NVS55_33155 [Myxococcus stipitatus]|uniref:hypothetical protein n=1 Tax=Myxococcus stipitatus TaxID=83455 RepID=UPI003144FC35